MRTEKMEHKYSLLKVWADNLVNASNSGLIGGRQFVPSAINMVAGPRAGAIEVQAGQNSGKLLAAMRKSDGALLRQIIPAFSGNPTTFMSGKAVRMEAAWPPELEDKDVRLLDIMLKSRGALGSGRVFLGVNEQYKNLTMALSDLAPHYLIAGSTGSGKTVALHSIIFQLAINNFKNRFVLIDGKYGRGLNPVSKLPGVVGPVATEVDIANRALVWAVAEMKRRFNVFSGDDAKKHGKLIIAVDEIQEFTDDEIFGEMIRKLTAQGREVGVHVLLATQHPTQDVFGDPKTKKNLSGRIALRVVDQKSSEVALGRTTPPAHELRGAGDAYVIGEKGIAHRTQVAHISESEIAKYNGGELEFSEWPNTDIEQVQQDVSVAQRWTADEVAASLSTAMTPNLHDPERGAGRTTLLKKLKELGIERMPGTPRANDLLEFGRRVHELMKKIDMTV